MSKPLALLTPQEAEAQRERTRRYYRDHRDRMLAQSKAAQSRRYARDPESFRTRARERYQKARKVLPPKADTLAPPKEADV